MDVRPRAPWLRTFCAAVGLAVSYFILAELGLRWATVNGEAASPVFPAAGIALAGLMWGGVRLWPAVFVGRMAAFLLGGASLPFWADLSMAAGATLAAVAGAKMLRWTRFDPLLRRLRDVLALILAALGSSLFAAVVGAGVLGTVLGYDAEQLRAAWLNWWAGDLTGMLIVTPLILSWALGEPIGRSLRPWLRLVLCTAAATLATWTTFGSLDEPLLRTFPLVPVLIWAALGGVRSIATAMVPVAAVAIWGTTAGYGPFAAAAAGSALESVRFVLLQEFIGLTAITGLVLAVVADERRGRLALQRRTHDLEILSRELRTTRDRLAATLAAAEIGTWMLDVPRNRVEADANLARLFSVPSDIAAAGAPLELFTQAIHPEDHPRVKAEIAETLARKESFEAEYRLAQPNGSTRWVIARGRVHRDHAGRAVSMPGVLVDITERRQAEEALRDSREHLLATERYARVEAERANQLKDEFLSTISHELRTPLHAILGWSQILEQRRDPETLERGLAAIGRNARSQAQLIDDLLDMSRINTGTMRLDTQSVDLRDVIAAAIETVRPAAEAKEIRIQQVLDPRAGPVRGDPSRLQQVVWNVLSNAVKFTPRQGKVQVALEQIDGHVEVTITDSGQGIDPDFLPFVFDRFRQADGSTTRQHGGLGLGLSIVEHLVELHGGRVQARSPGQGQGSTFIIELPLASP